MSHKEPRSTGAMLCMKPAQFATSIIPGLADGTVPCQAAAFCIAGIMITVVHLGVVAGHTLSQGHLPKASLTAESRMLIVGESEA